MGSDLATQADQAMIEGRTAEAIRLFEQATQTSPEDIAIWLKLAALHRGNGALQAALNAVDAAIAIHPADPLALLLKGNLHQRLGEPGRAAEIYRAALFHAESQPPYPPIIAQQFDLARSYLAQNRRDVLAAMSTLESLDSEHRRRALRLVENTLDRRLAYHQEPTHYRYPGLPDVEFFDDHFAGLKRRLHAAYPAIRAEFEALAQTQTERMRPYVEFEPGQPVGQWQALNHSRQWSALHLIRYGEIDAINAAACPQTMAAFVDGEQPDIPGLTPNLMFSLLAPQTSIPPHHGVANFRVVLHLPLIVPDGCEFRVGADTRSWREGEPWVFDDTIEHEAWNRSDVLRVILIADLWRPELGPGDREIARDFIAALDRGEQLGSL